MLGVRRAALRDWLTARGLGWSDDPTNDDAGFDRCRDEVEAACNGLLAELSNLLSNRRSNRLQ